MKPELEEAAKGGESRTSALLCAETKLPELLVPALRQYRHNDGTGLLFGFDHDETVNIISDLSAEVERLKEIIASGDDTDCDYLCKKCSHPYNVDAGENEDCPRCGYDGT